MKAQVFEITHTTTYQYPAALTNSYNLLHLSPRRMERQWPLSFRLEVDPEPEAQSSHTDYFGNEIVFTTFTQPHRHLKITSRSTVAVRPPYVPDSSETPAWETVARHCLSDRSVPALEAAEFLFSSPKVSLGRCFADYAAVSFSPRRPVLEAVLDLTRRIFEEFTFDPLATTLGTPVEQVLDSRRGVCQDFAHLQIACLRSLGIPARYVSGYLETIPPPGTPKLTGVDASHAWISFYSPGIGWIDVDPTNNLLPSMSHIVLGWGRDYMDVCPIRGVVFGTGQGPEPEVAVDVAARGQVETEEFRI